MCPENRKSSRIALNARVKVMHPAIGERILRARDISDGGMFISSIGEAWPAVGSLMQVQALDMPVEAEILNVRLVRKMADGIGVRFVD